jgi:hypothetical protein
MNRGNLIGQGVTAEVFEWGQNQVLKLYFEKYGGEVANREAELGRAVHDAGVPSPAVFETIDVDGRKGTVFQLVLGKTMLKHIEEEPWNIYYYAQQLAAAQFKIHRYSANSLPGQREKFAVKIKSSYKILGDRQKRILDYLDSLPDGVSVCHGDFHFNNIIVSGGEFIAIDWNGAYRGNPMGDVARTCLMMSSPAKLPGVTDMMMVLTQGIRWLTYWSYLNEYLTLAKATFDSIDEWLLPAAAAKLKDGLEDEENWLMDIIDTRLKLYGS